MSFPSRTPAWRRHLRFWRRDLRGEIADELRFHLEARVEELTASGLDHESARRIALEEFGDVGQVSQQLYAIDDHAARRGDRVERLRSIATDFRYAARSLRRTPIVAVTIVFTLALGIGVNAAMFSLLDVLYLRTPAGVVDPAGVHRVWMQHQFESGAAYWPGFDYPAYWAIQQALARAAETAIYTYPRSISSSPGAAASGPVVSYVSANYFAALGARPASGRSFSVDEDRLGAPIRVAVVSDAYWRRALGGDPNALGTSLQFGKYRYVLIGIMQRAFSGVDLDATDVWLPLPDLPSRDDRPWWKNRNVNGFQVIVRPRAGAAWPMIDAAITRAMHRPDLLYRPADTLQVARTGSIIRARGPGESGQELRIATRLGGVAAVVLLIAIANVVNLLLSRAVRRRQEIAVRLALGISRRRLVRLLVSESVLLSLVAGIAALLAAAWGGKLIRSLLLPDVHWASSPLHWRVLLFALLLALLGGIAAGLVPALQAANPDLTNALKGGAREGSVQRSRLRGVLVVTQVALSMLLLVGAALFLESLSNVRGLDIGFDAQRLVFAEALFADRDSVRDAQLGPKLDAIAERLRQAPGVQSVALTNLRPMYGFSIERYFPDADTVAHKLSLPSFSAVSPSYFATTGLQFLRGAGFGKNDRAVIINRAMADGLWPGENPVGRCIRFEKPDAPCFTVAGVVATSRRDNVVETPKPQYWVPLGVEPFAGFSAQTLIIRADPAAQTLVMNEVRRELVHEVPGVQPRITRMSDDLEPEYRPWEVGATLFTLFGLLALIVAAVGVYSTISYGVSQRMHEFGVRVALGARMADIAKQVVAGGVRTVLVGVLAGTALAIAGGRLIASLLYGIRPGDARVLMVVAATIVVIAIAAALIPAWRAARVDPTVALRAER